MLYEAQWLQLQRLSVAIPGLAAGLQGVRILHVSDLHAGARGPGGRSIKKFIAAAKATDPDLVVFTGDLTDKKKDLDPHISLLGEVGSRHGKFAVLGNHDHGLRKTVLQDLGLKFLGRETGRHTRPSDSGDVTAVVEKYRDQLSRAGMTLLENECHLVDINGGRVQVCGIDDYHYGFGDLAATAAQFDAGADLRILLTHSPDAFGSVADGEYQLVLAGHTHGGQICLPKPGGKILLSSSGSDYCDGIYQAGETTMHVSRGVGTTLLPFRLLSRPEITLLELESGDSPSTDPATVPAEREKAV